MIAPDCVFFGLLDISKMPISQIFLQNVSHLIFCKMQNQICNGTHVFALCFHKFFPFINIIFFPGK